LATALNGSALNLWEAPGGVERSPRQAHGSAVTGLAYSRDGKDLYSAGGDGYRVWEAATGKALRHQVVRLEEERAYYGGMPAFLDLSPDCKYLICGVQHFGGLQVRELATGEPVCDLEGTTDVYRGVGRVFAGDGTTFATLGSLPTPQ